MGLDPPSVPVCWLPSVPVPPLLLLSSPSSLLLLPSSLLLSSPSSLLSSLLPPVGWGPSAVGKKLVEMQPRTHVSYAMFSASEPSPMSHSATHWLVALAWETLSVFWSRGKGVWWYKGNS